MKIAVLDEISGSLYNLDVDAAEEIENVKAILEIESKIPLANQQLFYNGKEIQNNEKLNTIGVNENDLLTLKKKVAPKARAPASTISSSSASNSNYNPFANPMQQVDLSTMNGSQIQQHFKSNPRALQQIRSVNPQLAQLIETGDAQLIERVFAPIFAQQKEQRRQQELYRRLEQNPFDVEAQKEIEEIIRKENIMKNYENAYEYTPESFVRVTMLYIKFCSVIIILSIFSNLLLLCSCKVNDIPLKAFVDSGAQMTIMSKSCAEKCNLMRLLDDRFHGVAKGVGSAKILGRIHLTEMSIGNARFPLSITVLEQEGMEFLLGLDQLKRHQCSIDLKENCLKIGEEKAPFLSEQELKGYDTFEDQSPVPKASSSSNTSSSSSLATSVPPHGSQNALHIPSPTAVSGPSSTQATNPYVKEESINTLMSITGCTREKAVQALIVAKGNVDLAASALLGF